MRCPFISSNVEYFGHTVGFQTECPSPHRLPNKQTKKTEKRHLQPPCIPCVLLKMNVFTKEKLHLTSKHLLLALISLCIVTAAEEEQENMAAVIPTEADYMRELRPITHEEHIDVDYYHIPNVNMIESLNLATVRDLNTQDIQADNIDQGCIDSREDVIRSYIRFLIDTDVAFTSEDRQHPAPNETYVLPRILDEPKKKARKKVPDAPLLEDERDPFLDKDDDDEEEPDSGKKKKRRSASPAPQGKGRYPLCTPNQKKTKSK